MGGTVELWRQPNITKSETSGVRAQLFIGIGFTVIYSNLPHPPCLLHVESTEVGDLQLPSQRPGPSRLSELWCG